MCQCPTNTTAGIILFPRMFVVANISMFSFESRKSPYKPATLR
jgi:hypothetical protein